MSDATVKFLRVFLVLVEERSTAKAARRLGSTRPGIPIHIAAMERALGRRLPDRRFPPERAGTGRMQLTEVGRPLLPKATGTACDRPFVDAPVRQDAREVNWTVAAGLMELASHALRHDLPDEDRRRIREILPSRRPSRRRRMQIRWAGTKFPFGKIAKPCLGARNVVVPSRYRRNAANTARQPSGSDTNPAIRSVLRSVRRCSGGRKRSGPPYRYGDEGRLSALETRFVWRLAELVVAMHMAVVAAVTLFS